jgi:hypothetical protein
MGARWYRELKNPIARTSGGPYRLPDPLAGADPLAVPVFACSAKTRSS